VDEADVERARNASFNASRTVRAVMEVPLGGLLAVDPLLVLTVVELEEHHDSRRVGTGLMWSATMELGFESKDHVTLAPRDGRPKPVEWFDG